MTRWWWLVAALGACSGNKDTPTDPDTSDADTDADTDSDVDADTDTDSDADAVSLTGTIAYQRLQDGESECVASYDVAGTPYVGDCPDCAFAFDVTSTPSGSTGACAAPDQLMTLSETDTVVNLKLALVESYLLGGNTVTDAILWGHDLYYGGTTLPGPNWAPLGYDGSASANVTWDGHTLQIDSLREYQQQVPSHYLQQCGGTYLGAASAAFAGGAEVDGQLPCDGQSFDLYAFDAIAGALVQIRVDNGAATAPTDALAPFFSLTDDANCLVGHSFESFACAAQGSGGALQCPTLEFTAPATGTYHVAVETSDYYGLCAGGTGPYALSGNADGSSLSFTPVGAGLSFEETPITIQDSATFTATVTFAR